jgi:hypothetical protein
VGFLNCLITRDETWKNPKNVDEEFPHVQRSSRHGSYQERCRHLFFGTKVPVDSLRKDAIIMAKYYITLLNKLKQQLFPKH